MNGTTLVWELTGSERADAYGKDFNIPLSNIQYLTEGSLILDGTRFMEFFGTKYPLKRLRKRNKANFGLNEDTGENSTIPHDSTTRRTK